MLHVSAMRIQAALSTSRWSEAADLGRLRGTVADDQGLPHTGPATGLMFDAALARSLLTPHSPATWPDLHRLKIEIL